MEKFFYPRSVAVVGVSPDPDNLAQGIVANMLKFKYSGQIFLVGRRSGVAFGMPIYPSLRDLPQAVDLAVILAPARVVPELVEDCGQLGITRLVVETAGFSELNEAGGRLEAEVRCGLAKYGLRLVGPNGLGLMNMELGLALPFATIDPLPYAGRISIIAQSGGVATHLLAWMTKEGMALNKFLSLGNKLDVAENEVLNFLLRDPGTEAIYLYLEGLQDGRGLMAAARGAGKPVYLHVANVGPETAAIAQSHTASLTTDERVLAAACRQAGLIRLDNQAQFISAAKLTGQPPVTGDRLVVISRSGGEAVVAAYACRKWGFKLPPLSPGLARFIEEHSRAGVIRPTNPIDLGDIFDFSVYEEIMREVCRDPQVDAVLFHYGPLADFEVERGRAMAQRLVELAREAQKPLAVTVLCTLAEQAFFRETVKMPVFHFPEEAVQALAYSRYRAAAAASLSPEDPPALKGEKKIAGLLVKAGAGFLPLPQALALLEALEISAAPWERAATAAAAAAAAGRLGYPVVLKLSASSLVHKTEAGAVKLDLVDEAALEAAFAELAEVARRNLPMGEPWEALVMRQVAGGAEVLLGARRDPAFGPVVAGGAGGIATEILDDVALGIAPLSVAQARSLLTETRIGRILAGIRGQPAADLDALAQALAALGQLLWRFPRVEEVDLNPVKVFPGQTGLVVLDVRIKLGEG